MLNHQHAFHVFTKTHELTQFLATVSSIRFAIHMVLGSTSIRYCHQQIAGSKKLTEERDPACSEIRSQELALSLEKYDGLDAIGYESMSLDIL